MRWLHCFLDDCYELVTQLIQVHPVANCCAKGREGAGGIILAAVEAAVDYLLDARAQGLEQGGNCKRGTDNDDIALLVDDSVQEKLQGNDKGKVDQRIGSS